MKNMIRTNIRIYSDQKNDTNEYTNIFVSKKGYEYDTNEYSWQKIFEYIRISEYSSHYGSVLIVPASYYTELILVLFCTIDIVLVLVLTEWLKSLLFVVELIDFC